MQKKILLKLGGRKHLGEYRWKDALNIFDEIDCTCLYREASCPIDNKDVNFYEIKHNWINQKMTGLLQRTKNHKKLNVISWIAICVLKLANYNLLQSVKKLETEEVLCSYGDYDWSDLNCLIFRKVVNAPIVRSYKESRVDYNYLEYRALILSDIHVFYAIELKEFLEKKYGCKISDGKRTLIGYDENALPTCILDNISYRKKLSALDGKIHIVILSYRADSIPNRNRDQNRYYYVDVIKNMIDAGLIVHLHCAQYNNPDGINRYAELMKDFPKKFYMEAPLEMRRDSTKEQWISSCETLSRYDIGLLHNIVEESTVSEFDKINVPHRFFAYEAAHVTPIIKRGENIVLERMFIEKNCGFIYDNLFDLQEMLKTEVNYLVPTYEDYLKAIFDI